MEGSLLGQRAPGCPSWLYSTRQVRGGKDHRRCYMLWTWTTYAGRAGYKRDERAGGGYACRAATISVEGEHRRRVDARQVSHIYSSTMNYRKPFTAVSSL